MKEYIDLHTHSTASDGSYTPGELIEYAIKKGLCAIALTDHDNIDGLKEAYEAAKDKDIIFIPGIELSCDFDSELHIVGLDIDYKNKELLKKTEEFKEDRIFRNQTSVKRLNEIGVDISIEEAMKFCPGQALGRAHMAKVLVEKGYAESVKDAFRKYLGKGKPGFSNERRISYKEAISLIKKCRGKAILAHCHYLNLKGEEFEEFIRELKSCGLDGIEGYYTEYTDEQSKYYISVARKYGLIISGGSDFHGSIKPQIDLGTGHGNLRVPKELLENIIN